jgi:hypothetical protein
MSKALDEFLALRQASEADRGDPGARNPQQVPQLQAAGKYPDERSRTEPPAANCHPGWTSFDVPTAKLNAAELATYFADLLVAYPGARSVEDCLAVGDYLARAVVQRYGDPEGALWPSQSPFSPHNSEAAFWIARCPVGHLTDEALETHQVVGWACEQCQRVYDACECRLGPRPNAGPVLQERPDAIENIGLE